MSEGTGSGKGRDEIIDDLAAAMNRLRAAIEKVGEEIEANAHTEWDRAKPELRSTLSDLQRMVDVLAERAKTALGEMGSRLDRPSKRDG